MPVHENLGDINGDPNKSVRKSISRSQELIRGILSPNERLVLIFYESYTRLHTVVITGKRLLIFKNSSGGVRSKLLEYECLSSDLRNVVINRTGDDSFAVIFQLPRNAVPFKLNEYTAAMTLTQAANDLRSSS
jgi:hypothetical protein